jgi:hypothetical protein
MSDIDRLHFILEMLWRLPVAAVALVYDILGLPMVLAILVVVFCILGYCCLMKRIK